MLHLFRKPGQALRIGDTTEVIVYEVDRGQVKFGIRAPRTTAVHRYETRPARAASQTGDEEILRSCPYEHGVLRRAFLDGATAARLGLDRFAPRYQQSRGADARRAWLHGYDCARNPSQD